jgi:hypothetical protein
MGSCKTPFKRNGEPYPYLSCTNENNVKYKYYLEEKSLIEETIKNLPGQMGSAKGWQHDENQKRHILDSDPTLKPITTMEELIIKNSPPPNARAK